MAIQKKGEPLDMVKEACARLQMSRQTLLESIDKGFFTKPKLVRRGTKTWVRVFDEQWYAENEPKLPKSPPSGK